MACAKLGVMSAILEIPEVRQRVSPLSVEEYHRLGQCNQHGRRTELIRVPAAGGVLKSNEFPGLWLDTRALLRADRKSVLATLRRGLRSPEHRAFVAASK
jgi:hypothetical protein